MRQRITFIHEPGQGPDPGSIEITDDSLFGPDLRAAREEKLTLALGELPHELSDLLQRSCHELHIRWASPLAYESVSPLSSRISPGLHVFITPKGDDDADVEGRERLGRMVKKMFGVSGLDQAESLGAYFTGLPNDRFSHSAALQYYEQLESLTAWASFAKPWLCSLDPACESRAESFEVASSLDLSYDVISGVVRVTTSWPLAARPLSVPSNPEGHRTEVGILGADPSAHAEEHEIGMSGALTVLGEQKTPSPVVFAVPARHRQLDGDNVGGGGSYFSAEFLQPAGLHPTLQLSMGSAKPPVEDAYCAVHAHLTLPKTVFADRYQLSDELFLASKNLSALRWSSEPVDLEAPAYATKTWGSGVLVELAPPRSRGDASLSDDEEQAAVAEPGPWTAQVPLHLRYLEPNPEGYQDVEVPYPAVFWACTAEEGTKFPNSPFERTNLGYDALFGPRTVFWHVEPRPATEDGRLMSPVRVPALDVDDAEWVRTGTAAAVLLGFGWVLCRLLRTLVRKGYGRKGQQGSHEAKSKKDR